MREVIKTAKTVEEATALALEELGVSETEALIEIIDMPVKKFFRSIPAKVRVSVEDEEEVVVTQTPVVKEEKPVVTPKEYTRFGGVTPIKVVAPAQPVEKPVVEEETETFVEENNTPVSAELAPKVELAVNYLKEVSEKMGATKLDIDAVMHGDAIVLKVGGEDAGTLIGHHGEVMESLSYLCGLVANRGSSDYTRLNLDVNNYRSKRENNLVSLAKRYGAKVARTGYSQKLEPMNPYERRIIHSAISEMEGVTSESIGEGMNRRVVINSTNPRTPKGKAPRSNNNRGGNRNSNSRGPRPTGGREKTSTPRREFADKPRQAQSAPSVPVRTERVDDSASLPLYGKIEL